MPSEPILPETLKLRDFSSVQVRSYLNAQRTIIVPFGSFEQHGAALPVGTDATIAEALGDALSARGHTLVAPTLSVGASAFHSRYPGTISIKPETYIALVRDFLNALVQQGFTRLFLVNAHFENSGLIRGAAEQLLAEGQDTAIMLTEFWNLPTAKQVATRVFDEPGGHADAADAALMLKISPAHVHVEKFVDEWPKVQAMVSPDLHERFITKTGVIGSDQTKASASAGEEYFEAIIGDMLTQLATLQEIERG